MNTFDPKRNETESIRKQNAARVEFTNKQLKVKKIT